MELCEQEATQFVSLYCSAQNYSISVDLGRLMTKINEVVGFVVRIVHPLHLRTLLTIKLEHQLWNAYTSRFISPCIQISSTNTNEIST
jgi:hypothetical protein